MLWTTNETGFRCSLCGRERHPLRNQNYQSVKGPAWSAGSVLTRLPQRTAWLIGQIEWDTRRWDDGATVKWTASEEKKGGWTDMLPGEGAIFSWLVKANQTVTTSESRAMIMTVVKGIRVMLVVLRLVWPNLEDSGHGGVPQPLSVVDSGGVVTLNTVLWWCKSRCLC